MPIKPIAPASVEHYLAPKFGEPRRSLAPLRRGFPC